MYIKKYLCSQDVNQLLKIKQPFVKCGFLGWKPVIAYYKAIENREITGLYNEENMIGYIWIKYLKRKKVYRITEIVCPENAHMIIDFSKKYILDIWEKNTRSINFFESNNFIEIGTKITKNSKTLLIMTNSNNESVADLDN